MTALRPLSDDGARFLSDRHLATLSTIGRAGDIHVVAIGFTFVDGVVRIITGGATQKVRNVERDARATVAQVSGAQWLSIAGRAEIEREPDAVAHAVELYTHRYREPRVNPTRVVIRITPEKVLGSAGLLVAPLEGERRMTAPRIAFLDVDGTILDHGKTVAPSTVEAVRGARAAGHLVYLSTGRAAGDIHPDVAEIGFDGAITNGGAYATSGELTVVSDPMPRDAVEQLIAYMESSGILYFLQTDAAVYASAEVQLKLVEMMRGWMALRGDVDEAQTAPQNPPRFRDIADIDFSHVAKAVFLSDQSDTVARAQADLGDRFHVVPGSMPLPGGSNGEIGMRGTTKGSAILTVLDHLGLDAAASIGVGDSWNDVEMFEVCGVGIAMGNASPELKELADEVTTSVREDGIWNAFRRHGLV